MFGLVDGVAVTLLLFVVLIAGRVLWPRAVHPVVEAPRVWRYVIEHKTLKAYIGWTGDVPHEGVRLLGAIHEAARFLTKQEAEAVRATFDSFRDTYHVVAIRDEEAPPDGTPDV